MSIRQSQSPCKPGRGVVVFEFLFVSCASCVLTSWCDRVMVIRFNYSVLLLFSVPLLRQIPLLVSCVAIAQAGKSCRCHPAAVSRRRPILHFNATDNWAINGWKGHEKFHLQAVQLLYYVSIAYFVHLIIYVLLDSSCSDCNSVGREKSSATGLVSNVFSRLSIYWAKFVLSFCSCFLNFYRWSPLLVREYGRPKWETYFYEFLV